LGFRGITILDNDSQRSSPEETLDPKDWRKFRALSHQMIDDMLDYLQNIRSKSTHFPTKEAIEEICVHLSQEGEGEEKVYEVFQRSILPYTLNIVTPRFWGLVAGSREHSSK